MMKTLSKNFLFYAVALLSAASCLYAADAGTASGLTLLRNGGARSSALGEAFVSMNNDISAMDFNPASIATLESGQASLQHERGIFEDTFSKAMVGFRTPSKGTFGASLGYYSTGKSTLYDGVRDQRSVIAEQDRVASLAYAFQTTSFQWGANLRYLTSELAESASASAFSTELGVQHQLGSQFRVGVAGPVFQSDLKYGTKNEKLPRVYRAGLGWQTHLPLTSGNLPLQLLFDVPYDANDSAAAGALGAETQIGVLALRVGYNTMSDVQQFSIGTGFQFARMNLDYSFGMAENQTANALHKITFAFRFDDPRDNALKAPAALSSMPSKEPHWGLKVATDPKVRSVVPLETSSLRVYELKEGETLESIALSRYGSASYWKDIFEVNRYQYSSPDAIKPGARILLPAKKGS